MNIRALFASSSLLFLFSNKATNPKPVHGPFKYEVGVFYFPLNANTIVAIDSDDILGCTDITSLVQDRVPKLVEICNRATGRAVFLDEVRLRMILPKGEKYIVDMNAAVKHIAPDTAHTVTVGRLSKEDRQALHEQILWSFEEADNYYQHTPATSKPQLAPAGKSWLNSIGAGPNDADTRTTRLSVE